MEALVGRNWLDLPLEIWNLIAAKVDGNKDFIVFGSVCKTWQLASASVKHPESPPDFPLLVLSDGTKLKENTYEEELENIVQKRTILDIFSSASFDINLPEAYGKKCFAVNFGWLLTLSMDEDIELLHPFSRRWIKLPNVRAFSPPHKYNAKIFPEHMFIKKAVLSCSPRDNDACYVFIICDGQDRLAFTKIGDEYWTTIQADMKDVIYKSDGLVYALDFHGVIHICDINDEHPKAVKLTTRPPVEIYGADLLYLVELGDDLLLVRRILYEADPTPEMMAEEERLREERGVLTRHEMVDIFYPSKDETTNYYTTGFIMFKMEMEMDGRSARRPDSWTEIENLGNRALFIGDNASICLEATPGNKITSNCVYFTDNYFENYEVNLNGGGYDMGIMNLQDKSIRRGFTSSRSFYCTPFWYV